MEFTIKGFNQKEPFFGDQNLEGGFKKYNNPWLFDRFVRNFACAPYTNTILLK